MNIAPSISIWYQDILWCNTFTRQSVDRFVLNRDEIQTLLVRNPNPVFCIIKGGTRAKIMIIQYFTMPENNPVHPLKQVIVYLNHIILRDHLKKGVNLLFRSPVVPLTGVHHCLKNSYNDNCFCPDIKKKRKIIELSRLCHLVIRLQNFTSDNVID